MSLCTAAVLLWTAAVLQALGAPPAPLQPTPGLHSLPAPLPLPPACRSNIVQGSKEQKAAMDLLLLPENAGKVRPQLVAACAFALG